MSEQRDPPRAAAAEQSADIAGWHFDPVAQTLTREGQVRALSYRGAQVLWRLQQAHGQPVSRAELIAYAWPGQLPTDVALSQVIVELRRGLGEPARAPQHLLTVPRVGYRLAQAQTRASDSSLDGGPRRPRWRFALAALLLVSTVLALWRWSTAPSNGPPASGHAAYVPADPVPVAFSGLGERMPHLSADGAQLVYALNRDDRLELQVLSLHDEQVRPLTRDHRDVWPRFARDGRIAFQRQLPGGASAELHVVEAGGNESRVITSAAFEGFFDWHPDGDRIVAGIRDPDGRVQPQAIRIDDGRIEPFAPGAWRDDADWIGEPVFSPTGRHVLLRAGRVPASRLLLLDTTGGAVRVLTAPARIVVSYAWQDEQHLVLSAQSLGRSGLWHFEIAQARWTHLRSEPMSFVTAAAGRLVFPRPVAPLKLVQFSLGGRDVREVAPSAFDSYWPRFLGGSEQVLFLSTRNGSEQIWTQRGAAAESRWFPLRDATLLGFDVSPDGQRLVFAQEDPQGLSVQFIDADAQQPRRLDRGDFQHIGALALAADGDVALIAEHGGQGRGLYALAPDGTARLLVAGADLEDVQASPDGVLYLARRQPSGYYRYDAGRRALDLAQTTPLADLARWRVTAEGLVWLQREPDAPAGRLRLRPHGGGEVRDLGAWPTKFRPAGFDLRGGQVLGATVDSFDVNLMLWDLPPAAPAAPHD